MTPGAWEGSQPIRPIAEQLARDEWRSISGRRGTILDWTLLVLAAVSVALNVWFLFGPEPPYTGDQASWHAVLLGIDLAVCLVFAAAICYRWLRFRTGRIYLSRHWWEVPALIPFVIPFVDDRHWVMWIVLVARAARLADRTDNIFGDRFTVALIQHFSDPIIDAIKRPLTVAVLAEVNDVLKKGTYAANIRRAVEENRPQLEAMILELVKEDRATGRLRFVPFHDDLVRTTTDTVLRIVERALDDPRTDELVSDIIATSVSQIQLEVRERR